MPSRALGEGVRHMVQSLVIGEAVEWLSFIFNMQTKQCEQVQGPSVAALQHVLGFSLCMFCSDSKMKFPSFIAHFHVCIDL
jgi:hypothetical protein